MKTCVPIRARNRNELLTQVDLVQGRADVLEIWLDELTWLDSFAEDIKKREPKVILLGVCKTPFEQGNFTKDAKKKVHVLQDFLNSGGDFVDLDVHQNELKTLKMFPPERLWLSCHDFDRVPENIEEVYRLMCMFNPFGVKFALTPRTPLEYKTFVDFVAANQPVRSYYQPRKPEVIATTMGDKYGKMGRDELEQKEVTWGVFFALSGNHATASGQRILGEEVGQ